MWRWVPCPMVYIETGFLDNQNDFNKIIGHEGTVADGIVAGFEEWATGYYGN